MSAGDGSVLAILGGGARGRAGGADGDRDAPTAEGGERAGERASFFAGDEEGTFGGRPAAEGDLDVAEEVLTAEAHQVLDREVVDLEVGVVEELK